MEWIVAGFAGAVLFYAVIIYNGFVSLSKRADASWSDIDVQLKRRYNLIPNLVQAVKAYAGHERATLEQVAAKRTAAMAASGVFEQGLAEGALSGGVHRLIALAEAYPDLKADDNYLALQGQLIETENVIQDARRYFNAVIRDYNTKVESFPDLLIARLFGYRMRDYFELESEAEAEVPKVSV